MSHDRARFTLGAFAVIFDQQRRILLCHRRDHDIWNLPGGGAENGEAPWQTVIREVKEETGLDVAVKQLVGVYKDTLRDDLVFSFICEIANGQLLLNDEADEIAYFSLAEFPTNTYIHHVERVRDVLEQPDTMHLKWLSPLATL